MSAPREQEMVERVEPTAVTPVIVDPIPLAPVAVAHGNLSVEITTETSVSQPAPFSPQGQTVQADQSNITVTEDDSKLHYLEDGGSLEDVVAALNSLGATPRDLISILQAIKAAGALDADLEVR